MNDPGTKNTSDFSILDLYVRDYDPEVSLSFYQDLNLLQIIDRLTSKWGKNIRKYFRYLPAPPGR